MSSLERVTVTLPQDLLVEIDRRETNRSKFVIDAVRRELERRRHAELRTSLDNPHPESVEMAEQGFDEWSRGLPKENIESLVNSDAGQNVRWIFGRGWVEEPE